MSKTSIMTQIQDNLEWLEIDASNHSINSLIEELKNHENVSMAFETILLINLYLDK